MTARRPRSLPHYAVLAIAVAIAAIATRVASAQDLSRELVSGPVTVLVSVEPEAPVIGDTITLKISVTAEKDVEVLMPDFGEALDRFAIVDFAPRQSIDEQGRTVSVQTYRLDPPSSGRQVIPSILIEYVDRREGQKPAPDDLDAYEVLTDRIVFEVASVLPDAIDADLKPPLGELKPLDRSQASTWIWWIVGLVVVAIVAPLATRALLESRRRARRRSAYDLANAKLEKLLGVRRETAHEIESFYVQLSSIVRRYIEDRFDYRAAELTTEEFLSEIADSPEFTPEHQTLLREFLSGADLVKFARALPPTGETDRSIERARQFLDETRENAPLLEVEDSGEPTDAAAKAEVAS